jgi:hypothetical protein
VARGNAPERVVAMKGDNRAPHPVLEEGTLPEPPAATATSALQGVLSAGSNGDASASSFLGMIRGVRRKLSIGGGALRPRMGSGGSGSRMDGELGAFIWQLCNGSRSSGDALPLSTLIDF